jgi:hypothetical protein
MFRSLEMQDVTTSVREHDMYLQDAQCRDGHRAEIDGDAAISVIGEEGAPALRWWLSLPLHVPEDHRL